MRDSKPRHDAAALSDAVQAPRLPDGEERCVASILIPCLDEAPHIERVVRQALGQLGVGGPFEVLVADGGSRDGTRELLDKLRAREPRLTVVDNPAKIQAAGLNQLITRARGEVLIRMDAHGDYPLDYVARCLEVLAATGADVVGGAQRLSPEAPFQRAVAAALDGPLGTGGAAYRAPSREGWVDTVFLGAYRRRVFEDVGLYDPEAVTNEDAELNQRVLASGGRIWLARSIVAHYRPRATLRALLKQYRRYGDGRARTFLKHRGVVTLRPLVPVLSLLVLLATLALSPRGALALIGGYVAIVSFEAARRAPKHHASRVGTALALTAMHLGHATGFLLGLARHAGRRGQVPGPRRIRGGVA